MGQQNSRIQRLFNNKKSVPVPCPRYNLLAIQLRNSMALALHYQMMAAAAAAFRPRPIQPIWNLSPCIQYPFGQQPQHPNRPQSQQQSSQSNKQTPQVCSFVPRLGFSF